MKHLLWIVYLSLVTGAWSAAPSEETFASLRAYHEAQGGVSILVMHEGKVLHESYSNGGSADRCQLLASGTKSFCGVIAAAAVADGLLEWDMPLAEVLVEWKGDPVRERVTLRHLLSLTSGLADALGGGGRGGPGWEALLDSRFTSAPGQRFSYGAAPFNLFGLVLERKLKEAGGERFTDYFQRRILDPLGIQVEWRLRNRDGTPQLGGGAAMTARDWAIFGEFLRNGGMHNGVQVIPTDVLAECFRGTKANPAYGLSFWLARPVPQSVIRSNPMLARTLSKFNSADSFPDDLFMAAGLGNQRLYVIPSRGLVVVRQATLTGAPGFSDAEFVRILLGESEQ
jgi:CubicO group peptidase (beta-lactamase class C family)